MTGHVLVLGGTTEARALAVEVGDLPDVRLTTSLPSTRAVPADLPGEVHHGGFGGPDGLAAFLRTEGVRVVVDATSPFAARITETALLACAEVGVPLLVLERPSWVASSGDDWRPVPDLAAAAAALAAGPWERALVAAGARELGPLARLERPRLLLRVTRLPEPPLPRGCEVLLRSSSAGDVDVERRVLVERGVGVVVTTDSGGPGAAAVLVAAREVGLPVLLVQRPLVLVPGGEEPERVASPAEAVERLLALLGPAQRSE